MSHNIEEDYIKLREIDKTERKSEVTKIVRLGIAILSGLLSWIIIVYFTLKILEKSNFHSFVESNNIIGELLFILSIMPAARIGLAINYGSINGNVTKEDNIDFFIWFIGGLVFAICCLILYSLIGNNYSTTSAMLQIFLRL